MDHLAAQALSYLPQDRRRALTRQQSLPLRAYGTVLFADVSGFTPLTEALAQTLGPRRGAEELIVHLNRVYATLITEVERYGGSVVSFAGDAIICWFPDIADATQITPQAPTAALTCALAMQVAMRGLPPIPTPNRGSIALTIKIAIASGIVHRYVVGEPTEQIHDVLVGETLARMGRSEYLAQHGETLIDETTYQVLAPHLSTHGQRVEPFTGEVFTSVAAFTAPASPQPSPTEEPTLPIPAAEIRPWLLPAVFERLQAGVGDFLTELRVASLLFLKFSGLDYDQDEKVAEKFDAFIRWAQRGITKYGGTLLQVIMGDKGSYLYAVFGALSAHEDSDRRAASAALELITPPNTYITAIQIGLSRGIMRVGGYGCATRRTYSALGNEANHAARLMEQAAPGQILASAHVRRAVGDVLKWELLPGQVKTAPSPIYILSGLLHVGTAHIMAANYLNPLVGRSHELALIAQKVSLATQGRGQIVGLQGEAGVGKSRLLAEVIKQAQVRGVACYMGECQSFGLKIAYLAWREIWRDFFNLDATATPSQQIRRLTEALVQINPRLVARMPLLDIVLDLPIPDNALTRNFDAQLRKESLENLLIDCLRHRVERPHAPPILFALENSHWLDPLSHDLLEALGRATAKLPIIILMAYRPPEAQRWQVMHAMSLPQATEIQLGEFTLEETAAFIQARFPQLLMVQQSQRVLHKIFNRAQGNPFYIEELLNYLRDKAVDLTNPDNLTSLDLPTSLHTLILSRLDALTEHEKVLLKVASVIGQAFPAPWLQGYYPTLGSLPQLQAALEKLRELDITYLAPGEADLTYLFKHSITQEVVYESMPYAMRADLHERLAAYLEHIPNAPPVDLLAYHYEHSENTAKKHEYFRKAGDFAYQNHALEQATEYYEKSLPLITAPAERFTLYHRIAQALQIRARYDDAIQAYQGMYEMALALNDLRLQAQAVDGVAQVYLLQGNLPSLWEAVEEAERLAEQEGAADNSLRARALCNKVWAMIQTGKITEALPTSQRALEMCLASPPTLEIKHVQARCLNGIAAAHLLSGQFAEARQYLEQTLALNLEIDDRPNAGSVISNLGELARMQGDYVTAVQHYTKSLAINREMGDRRSEMISLSNIGGAYVGLGDYATAETELQQVLVMVGGSNWVSLGETYRFLAEAYLGQGKIAEALQAGQRAKTFSQESSNQEQIGAAWRVLGKIYSQLPPDPTRPSPIECFNNSLKTFRELGAEVEQARTLREWALYAQAQGETVEAKAFWEEAYIIFKHLRLTHELARMDAAPLLKA